MRNIKLQPAAVFIDFAKLTGYWLWIHTGMRVVSFFLCNCTENNSPQMS